MAKRILIVDDEPDVVRYLSSVLESHDYEVATADNSADAMEAVRGHRPDLICLDIMMPEESGLSLYVKLRRQERTRRIPVIVVSGMVPESEFDLYNYVNDTSISPPEAYVEKPIDVSIFLDTVARLAQGRSSDAPSGAGGRRQ